MGRAEVGGHGALAEREIAIHEGENDLWDFIADSLDVKNNTAILRLQKKINIANKLRYGNDVKLLVEDGDYGKQTIRAQNAFKNRYLDNVNNVIRLMKEKLGAEYMMNPENSPKLPGYQDPAKMQK